MQKALSILLAIVFFISNTGYTLASHYCGGKIHKQSISFIEDDLSCGMENSKEKSCGDQENSLRDNCCQNQFQKFKITNEFKVSLCDVKLNRYFFKAFIMSCADVFFAEPRDRSEHFDYHPPSLDKDIPMLIQSFLI